MPLPRYLIQADDQLEKHDSLPCLSDTDQVEIRTDIGHRDRIGPEARLSLLGQHQKSIIDPRPLLPQLRPAVPRRRRQALGRPLSQRPEVWPPLELPSQDVAEFFSAS